MPSPALAASVTLDTVQRVGHADPIRMAAELGIAVRYCSLEAEKGGLESTLVPDHGAPLEIHCDPWIPPEGRDRLRFRVAHKLADTFFCDWRQSLPKQLRPPSAEEGDGLASL